MKYSSIITTAILLISVLVLQGCDRPSNRMDTADNSVIESERDLSERDLEDGSSEVNAEVQVFRNENEEKITENNRLIAEIREKIRNETDMEVKARHELRLEAFEEANRELKRDMDNYRASTSDDWSEFKDDYADRMENLGDSLKDFFSPSNTTTSSIN